MQALGTLVMFADVKGLKGLKVLKVLFGECEMSRGMASPR